MEMPLSTGPCVSVTEDTIMDAEYSLPEDVDKRMFWELFPVTSSAFLSKFLTRNETEFTFFAAR